MKQLISAGLLFVITSCFLPHIGYCQDSTKIQNMLNEVSYGVPNSPAFELLPNKPSEVTHLATANDISANISSFVDGGKLRSGAAFDIRPFAYTVGSLKTYQDHPLKQILWRSVFSLGTASESKTNSDVYIGAGLRIPIIDHGDPRANRKYLSDLENAYVQAFSTLPPPPFNETAADFQKRLNIVDSLANIKSIRNNFVKDTWNAMRWDVGIGASERAASGFLKADSLFKNRVGIWSAFGFPISKIGELTVSGNTAWVSAKSDTSENNRNVLGARAQFFITDWLSASGEYAQIFSNYSETKLNEQWNHLAIVVEFKMPVVGGWFSLAYGGDSTHRTDSGTKFSFNYAIYTDRLIKKGK